MTDLSEREAVRRFLKRFVPENNPLGYSDDAAVLPWGGDFLVVTTDLVSRSAHMPEGMTSESLGWMSAAVNLSDLAAKGATPLGFLIAMGLPRAESETVDSISKGVHACLAAFSVELLGGDTKPAAELTLAGTALGRVPQTKLMRRTGARPGDVLCVTGELGGAGAGLLAVGKGMPQLARRLFEPMPRVKEGMALAASGAVTSCTDISDGLALSLSQMSALGPLGFRVDEERLPLDPLVRKLAASPAERRELALHAGGDYELLLTARADRVEEAGRAVESAGGFFSAIGEVVDGRKAMLVTESGEQPIPPRGYEHWS